MGLRTVGFADAAAFVDRGPGVLVRECRIEDGRCVLGVARRVATRPIFVLDADNETMVLGVAVSADDGGWRNLRAVTTSVFCRTTSRPPPEMESAR